MKPLTRDQLKFYENVKFVHGGDNLWGADCFGLIKLVNLREYGNDIGAYERTHPNLACRSIDGFFKRIVADGVWIPVEPYTGCTVVTSSVVANGKPLADHVGIYIEGNEILSTDMIQKFSKIIPLEGFHVLGYYEFNPD